VRYPAPRITTAALALSLILAGSACGGNDDSPEATGGDPESSEGVRLEVTAEDFSFSPGTLSVDTSEEAVVAFTNEDGTAHTFTSDELEIDMEASGGESQEGAFTAPAEDATYSFYCRFHPGQMTGKIIVGTGGEATDDSDTGEGAGENDDGIDY
jgi:plastocyanin